MINEFDRRTVLAGAVAGALAAGPSYASATISPPGEQRSFDFLEGRWDVRHRQLRRRLAGNGEWFEFPGTLRVQPVLGGLGNFDRNELSHPKGAYEAHSLRLYNPAEGKWSIWWLDSRGPNLEQPVVGAFDGAIGTFFGDDTFENEPIRVRTTYEPLSPSAARWTQAFSNDAEATWEVNWVMDFQRQRP